LNKVALGLGASDTSVNSFVELSDVSLRYGAGGTLAIEHVDLGIKPGEFAAVVGPSGCGKSTLMKLVTGLLPPTAGTVRVAGKVVNGPLKIVGMAFQNPTLLPWRNTLSNTMLPLEIVQPHRSRLRRHKQEYVALAHKLLAAVGLDGFEQKQPWMLSGGMQQRASLCRALIHNPELLMLDEPFAALDAFTREELWAVLQDLWMERKFTCTLVTHDLREATYLADVIFVMSARPGRIVATHRIDLPRPRTLDMTFEPKFVDAVHRIRMEISQARTGARTAAKAQPDKAAS
jgi:NitT/TauT family transport system ATP-binding protein